VKSNILKKIIVVTAALALGAVLAFGEDLVIGTGSWILDGESDAITIVVEIDDPFEDTHVYSGAEIKPTLALKYLKADGDPEDPDDWVELSDVGDYAIEYSDGTEPGESDGTIAGTVTGTISVKPACGTGENIEFTYTITKKPLTISAFGHTKNYDGGTLAVFDIGQATGNNVYALSGGKATLTDAASNVIEISGFVSADVTDFTDNATSETKKKEALGADSIRATYSAAAVGTKTLTAAYSVKELTGTIWANYTLPANFPATLENNGAGIEQVVIVSGTAAEKLEPHVTIGNKAQTYSGAPATPLTLTFIGNRTNPSTTNASTQVPFRIVGYALTGGADPVSLTPPTNAGTYDIFVSIGSTAGTKGATTTVTGTNYATIDSVKITSALVISKKDVSISVTGSPVTSIAREYNSTTGLPPFSAAAAQQITSVGSKLSIVDFNNGNRIVLDGFVPGDIDAVNGDAGSFTLQTVQGTYNLATAGSPRSVTFSTLAFTNNTLTSNYNITGLNTAIAGAGAITKRQLVVTSVTHTKVYDRSADADFGFTWDPNTSVNSVNNSKQLTISQTIGGATRSVVLDSVIATDVITSPNQLSITGLKGAYVVDTAATTKIKSGDVSGTTIRMNHFVGEITGTASLGRNYELAPLATQSNVTVTGGITPKAVTIVDVGVETKVNDETPVGKVVLTNAKLEGVITPDVVSINDTASAMTATFIGAGTPPVPGLYTVNFTGFSLAGVHKDNYVLSGNPASVQGRILPANGVSMVTIRGTATLGRTPDSLKLTAEITPATAANWRIRAWEVTDPEGLVTYVRDIAGIQGVPGISSSTADTLVLRARNMGNGTVRVVAIADDGSDTRSAPFTLTVTGQRSAPQGFAIIPGISKVNELGQAILSWTAPQSGTTGVEKYEVKVGDGEAWTLADQTTGHTIGNLVLGLKTSFHVRAIYNDGSVGPTAKLNDSIPTVRDSISRGEIGYSAPGVQLVYNRAPQNIGRATLAANTYTVGGVDPFDTLYLFKGTANGVAWTGGDATPVKWADAKFPTDSGTYTADVIFVNSRFAGKKTVTFKIGPKPLTTAMITFPSPMPTFTFDGSYKEFSYTIVDGNVLELGKDYIGTSWRGTALNTESSTYAFNRNASSNGAFVRVQGFQNYTGTVSRAFSINRKTITLDTANSYVTSKVYDGTADARDSSLTVRFDGEIIPGELVLGGGYTVTNAKFANANAATDNNVVTATIQLVANGYYSQNYTLSSTPSFRKVGSIVAKEPDTSDFTFSIPTDHIYNGVSRGIGPVAIKTPRALVAGDTLTVLYSVDGKDTTGAPLGEPTGNRTYPVKVRFAAAASGKSNFISKEVSLGDYVVSRPVAPVISAHTVRDTTFRLGNRVTLSVTAVSPNDGILSYQWYRNDVAISGARAASFTVIPDSVTTSTPLQYYVQVTNSKAGVQTPDSVKSATATITVREPAVSLIGSVVTVGGDGYVYGGAAIPPQNVTVTRLGQTLSEGSDYVVVATNNVNAGRATVIVRGIDAFKDSSSGFFNIARKVLEPSDLSFNTVTTYNATAQRLTVGVTGGRTGLGSVAVRYWTDSTTSTTTPPTAAGDYEITVDIGQGLNFTASDTTWNLGTYTILQKSDLVASDFNHTIPGGHKYTGSEQGIGEVTLKGRGTAYGSLTVLYNGAEELPVEIGVYDVAVEVSGDTNYAYQIVPLGVYEILDPQVGVASNDRVIPGSGSEVVVVAPVQVVAGEFTVGPNPVAKASGKAGFFWQGKAVKSGALYVFDASGNLVTKVAVSDNGSGTARREIGSWNLTANGAPVAEGTYLVKGALVGKDGSKVKVSSILGVAR